MKILVIFTGGTIGSSSSGKYTSPDSANNYVLINNYTEKYNKEVCFDTFSPFSMLSENLSHKELNAIIKAVSDNLEKAYDGIILTHGTDSLQYTAAALAYCCPAAKKPVILVSSRYPLSHPGQNGNENFAAAVSFIESKPNGGVYISYRNEGDTVTHIHYGTRAYSHLEISDSVYSISDRYYATVKDGKVTLNPHYRGSEKAVQNTSYEFAVDSGVLVVSSVPGDNYSYSLEGKKAVLLRPYHSGTVNTASNDFKAFCMRAKDAGIPVFLPRADIETVYASTELFNDLEIKYLPCMTFISAYVKLWIAVSIGADVTKFMYNPLSDEFII